MGVIPESEIDCQVADALGLEILSVPMEGVDPSARFRPSTDWNDAMFAVQAAQLLSNLGEGRFEITWQDGWECGIAGWDRDYGWVPIDHRPQEETGPLAICKTILWLKGKRDADPTA